MTLLGFIRKSSIIMFILVVFFGCSPSRIANIENRVQPPSQKISSHIVSSGETLFAIAWRYGLTVNQLSSINNLSNSDVIYPGQRLALVDGNRAVLTNRDHSPGPTRSQSRSRQNYGYRQENTPVKNTSVGIPPSSNKRITWRWPHKGRVVTNFGDGRHKSQGLDIKGKKGDPIKAAASGRVVFAGSGLRGYGELIIIKHNDLYLSAYGHNNRLHVKEGDFVKVGQHIADLGSTGADFDKLHFEIRRDGKPVNPKRYLL